LQLQIRTRKRALQWEKLPRSFTETKSSKTIHALCQSFRALIEDFSLCEQAKYPDEYELAEPGEIITFCCHRKEN
jgi:hypothetical protein